MFNGEILRVVPKGTLEAEEAEANRKFLEPKRRVTYNRWKDADAADRGKRKAVAHVKYVAIE